MSMAGCSFIKGPSIVKMDFKGITDCRTFSDSCMPAEWQSFAFPAAGCLQRRTVQFKMVFTHSRKPTCNNAFTALGMICTADGFVIGMGLPGTVACC